MASVECEGGWVQSPGTEMKISEVESLLSIIIQKRGQKFSIWVTARPSPKQTASHSHDQRLLVVNGGKQHSPLMPGSTHALPAHPSSIMVGFI